MREWGGGSAAGKRKRKGKRKGGTAAPSGGEGVRGCWREALAKPEGQGAGPPGGDPAREELPRRGG